MEENAVKMNEKRRNSKRRTKTRQIKKTIGLLVCFAVLLSATAFLLSRTLFYEGSREVSELPYPVTGEDKTTPAAVGQNGVDKQAWNLILVNRENFIPDEYEVDLTQLSNGQSVDTRIYSALQEMFDAARADGVYPIVASGYRTAEKQQSLMDEKIAAYEAEGYSSEEAKEEAQAWVAIPGTSEHQLGIAVDINADGIQSVGDEVYDWLDQNSYRYGFIKRYPSGKTEITGTANEPWHYRYVGVEAATEIYRQGLCLEEYLEK